MQYRIVLTVSEAEDIFELAKLLAPLQEQTKIKFSEAVPRPTAGQVAGKTGQEVTRSPVQQSAPPTKPTGK